MILKNVTFLYGDIIPVLHNLSINLDLFFFFTDCCMFDVSSFTIIMNTCKKIKNTAYIYLR